jgi:hypothetical protein
MPTGVQGVVPRQDPRQVTNTLKKTVNYNDAGIATGLPFENWLPQGAFITSVLCEIVVVFNAATTNVLTVGTNSTAFDNIINAGDVNEAAVAVTSVVRALGRGLAAAGNVRPYAKYTQTGAAATTGQAVICIEFEGGWAS